MSPECSTKSASPPGCQRRCYRPDESISQATEHIVVIFLRCVAGKTGIGRVVPNDTIRSVAAAETLEAPAACRGKSLRVLVHHAYDFSCALGHGIVGRFRFEKIEHDDRAIRKLPDL